MFLYAYLYYLYIFVPPVGEIKSCSVHHECPACKLCSEGRCKNYKIGKKCHSKLAEKDVHIYWYFFYQKFIYFKNMLCTDDNILIEYEIGKPLKELMSINFYLKYYKDSVIFLDKCNEDNYILLDKSKLYDTR